MKAKYLGAFVFLVVLAAAILLVVKAARKQPANSEQGPGGKTAATQTLTASPVPAEQVPAGQLPKAFPADLPLEKNARVLENFETKDQATGKVLSTRVYVSAKTLDENWAAYQKYAKDEGWKIISSINQ